MSKSKKRKPSFDLPRKPSAPIDTTWVYRSDDADRPPVAPWPAAAAAAQPAAPAAAPQNGASQSPSLSRSLLRGTLFVVDLSLDIGDAVPKFGYDALSFVAGYVPGSGVLVGILHLPVRANSAALAAGKKLIHAISGETTSAHR